MADTQELLDMCMADFSDDVLLVGSFLSKEIVCRTPAYTTNESSETPDSHILSYLLALPNIMLLNAKINIFILR